MKNKFLYILYLLTLNSGFVFSQDGNLDLNFNSTVHQSAPDYNGFQGTIYATKILSSGKILVYGELTAYMGTPVNHLVRLNTDGTLDTTFNSGTGPNDVSFSYQSSNLISEQTDGKIVIVGVFTSFNGIAKNYIVRLNNDGSVDSTFNIGSGANAPIHSVKIQNDGKILCGGVFTSFNGVGKNRLVRLNTNGSVDSTLNIGSGFNHSSNNWCFVHSIEIQPDGKILAGGIFTSFNGVSKKGIVRLNSNGSIDNTFLIGTGTNDANLIRQIKFHIASNTIYFCGSITTFNGLPANNIISLNLDGTLNSNFNVVTNVADEYGEPGLYDFAFLNDNRIIVCGNFVDGTNEDLYLYNSDGTSASDFNFITIQDQNTPLVNTISVDSNNGIYISGYFQNINNNYNAKGSIVKIFPNGQTDISFNPNLGGNSYNGLGYHAMEMSNGKILLQIDGLYNEKECNSLSIGLDGAIYEPDFVAFKSLDLTAYNSKISSTGNIFISNNFLYKITENGVLDNSFANTSNLYTFPVFNVYINDHVEQPDGKVIIAGYFRLNTAYYKSIIKLNSDGTVDNSFNSGTGFGYDRSVKTLALQTDNKIIVGGDFISYNGINNINNIVRLNPNGSIDNTFAVGSGFNHFVKKVLITSDNKIMVSGSFTHYNNILAPHLVKLNMDGTIDTSFTSPFPEGDFFTESANIIEQPDGKFIVSGYVNQTQVLYRINSDGSLDSSFNNNHIFTTFPAYSYVLNPYDNITSITLLSNNKILITGSFKAIDGIRRNGLAMLNNSPSLSINENTIEKNFVSIYPNPVENILTIDSNRIFDKIEIYGIDGKQILSSNLIENKVDLASLKQDIYIAKIISNEATQSLKFIKK